MRHFYILINILAFQFGVAQLVAPSFSYNTPIVLERGCPHFYLTPTSTGGAVDGYEISPTLPYRMYFDSDGSISGTPTDLQVSTDYVVTGTNAAGSSLFTISIEVVDSLQTPQLRYDSPQTYTINAPITPLSPTITGGILNKFSIYPDLPSGLSFNSTTGVISGTPLAYSPQSKYTITGKYSCNDSDCELYIKVTSQETAPIISYTNPQKYITGTTIYTLSPTNYGGEVVSYAISPVLPEGLVFNTTTGVITGTPTMASYSKIYIISATNAVGVGTFALTINIEEQIATQRNTSNFEMITETILQILELALQFYQW